jgi:ribitol-5-phosphate 2-dehydrogenase
MINRIYRLIDAKRIEMVQRQVAFGPGSVLIRPEYMAICAADQRYYLGRRKKEILSQKLPMALIHEATGTVLHDFTGRLPAGAKAVLIPLDPEAGPAHIKGNYRQGSAFASSGADGFMQDIVALPHERLIPIAGHYSVISVFTEILSVAIGAVSAFETACVTPRQSFGVWGDGSMGYTMSLVLKCLYPGAGIYVFGKTARKLRKFSFATETFYIDQAPADLEISHGFECVGNAGSEAAIEQITALTAPQGCISLLGVSEEPVPVNTRRILEKGLRLIGNSRSDASDFQQAAALIHGNELCRRYLHMLISEVIEVKTESHIARAFDQDVLNDFKTVIQWSL